MVMAMMVTMMVTMAMILSRAGITVPPEFPSCSAYNKNAENVCGIAFFRGAELSKIGGRLCRTKMLIFHCTYNEIGVPWWL